ncbi:MAG: cytochrome c biogenesis heme-transporting ATPase CcmA [Bdellovibrio sp.]|nr:cytochrome c biogenesis heme-transporting ATPase CcmA [Methylotenera sp.]
MKFSTSNFELTANDLSAVRGERLLFKQLNFSLKNGTILYLQGANGTGKTTLLRMLCGLSKPYSGVINWCGNNINELAEDFHQNILYIGHLPSIKEDLTALENLQFSLALTGDSFDFAHACEVLKLLGLGKALHLPTRVLSQGQKRRVALARLWLQNLPLWILDEPFTALDVAATELLKQKIEHFANAGGVVVMTTHQEVLINAPNFVQLRLEDLDKPNHNLKN